MFGLSQDNCFFRQRPRWIVGQIGADKPPAYPLRPVADRGRGDGSSPTCGMGSDRSFPLRKSLCVPAARLPAGYSKLPAIQLWEDCFSSH